jgi:hypothetical protein
MRVVNWWLSIMAHQNPDCLWQVFCFMHVHQYHLLPCQQQGQHQNKAQLLNEVRQGSVELKHMATWNMWSFEMRGPVILKIDFVCEFNLIRIVLTTQKWF